MTFFVAGAFSLTIITLIKVIGIMMPNLANILISYPCIVYATLVGIWTISIGSAAPSIFFREYDVSTHLIIYASLPQAWFTRWMQMTIASKFATGHKKFAKHAYL